MIEQAARCRNFAELISHPVRKQHMHRARLDPPSYKELAFAGLHELGLTNLFESTYEIYIYHLLLAELVESEYGT